MTPKRHNARQAGMPSQRQLRMGEAIRHALAEVTARGDIRDPQLRDLPITITEVRPSPDLRRATAFVTPLGGQNMDEIVGALNRARGFYRAKVAQMVEAKYVQSEEHTSELQSRENLVCRLLLEKKTLIEI